MGENGDVQFFASGQAAQPVHEGPVRANEDRNELTVLADAGGEILDLDVSSISLADDLNVVRVHEPKLADSGRGDRRIGVVGRLGNDGTLQAAIDDVGDLRRPVADGIFGESALGHFGLPC